MQTRSGRSTVLVVIAMLFVGLAPMTVQADTSGGCDDGPRTKTIPAVAGVVAAGPAAAWASPLSCAVAHSATQVLQWTGTYTGPAFVVAPTVTWSTAMTGCTASAVTVVNFNDATGSDSIAAATITMTSTECRGTFSVAVTATVMGATGSFHALFPVNIRVEQPNFMFLCNATEATANAYAPGTATCQEPQLNNLNYQCAATGAAPDAFSESTTTCLTPDMTLTVSGIPDTQQEIQAIADALSAGIDVTICPQIAPCYQVLSGAIDTTTNITIGNNTVMIDKVHLCGPPVPGNDSACPPIEANAGVSFPIRDGEEEADWLLVGFWVAAILFFMYLDWVFALAFAIPGLFDALFPVQIPEEFVVWFLFCLLGVVAQYFAGDRFKFSLRGKKKGA